jgi:hypothetical protein
MEKSIINENDEIYDGGEHTISCSNCRKQLVKIVVSRPKNPVQTTLTAHCPYCHNKSFAKTIEGVYVLGTHNPELVITDIQTLKSDINTLTGILKQELIIAMEKKYDK